MTARAAMGTVVAVIALFALAQTASAATFNVNTTADHVEDKFCNAPPAGDCTIRDALAAAGSADTINIPAASYVLTVGELGLVNDHIVGAGARTTTISGNNASRVFSVIGASNSIAGVRITGGNGAGATASGSGGGVFVAADAVLTISNSTVSGNTGTTGGGIAAAGTLGLGTSTVSGNTARTGRLSSGGGITIGAAGGAAIVNSTISGNTAADTTGNASQGGGIASSGALSLNGVTIANNTAASAGGLYEVGAAAGGPARTIANTIVGGNAGDECGGSGLTSDTTRNNVSDDTTCAFAGTGDRQGSSAQLGALADNGGNTNTHALLPASPAINNGNACATSDQRGIARPQPVGGQCDVGAYEYRAPTLRVITSITNDAGGTRAAGEFTVHVRQGAADVKGSPQPGNATGTTYTLAAGGTYVVDADGVAGYVEGVTGSCGANGSITLAEGQDATCTVTEGDVAPTLKVVTQVVNDAGGTLAPADFTARVTGPPSFSGPGSASGTTYTLIAGLPYTVSADAVPGYTRAVAGSCAVTPTVGQVLTCTITASDTAPTLKVVTNVVNDDGGTRTVGSFTARVTGTPSFSGAGSATGTTYTVRAATPYAVSVDAVAGYSSLVADGCSSITLALAQNATCTVTMNDIQPILTVRVLVDDNGTGQNDSPEAFRVSITQGGSEVGSGPGDGTGREFGLDAGSYAVAAEGPGGYSTEVADACAPSGTVALAVGDRKTCTITKIAGSPTLSVISKVVNDDGGTAKLSDFNVHVMRGGADVPSSPRTATDAGPPFVLPVGAYAVSSSGPAGYTTSYSGDCAGGNVSLAVGDDKSCTVTRDDLAPTLTVITKVVNDSGGTLSASAFSIHVRKGAADVSGSPKPGSASGTKYTLTPGSYAAAADAVPGYSAAGCTVALQSGDAKTCTVTANDAARVVASSRQLPPPQPGRNVNALSTSGTIRVKLPGATRFVPMDEDQQIPLGTVVDVIKGRVTIVSSATDKAVFYGGIFKLGQTKGKKPTTVLTLVQKLTGCKTKGRASVAAKKKKVKKRRLWGDGKGKFTTKGKHSAATVVGTKWMVEDRCTSTLTRVARGKVRVKDFAKHKTVLVKTGKKYVARAR